jgi:hypothetical protein
LASKAEIVQGWGVWPSETEFLQGFAGLWTELLQGFAVLGSLASKAEIVQGWGPQPSEMEFLQGCAGLGGHGLVEIISVCGSLALRAPPMENLQV